MSLDLNRIFLEDKDRMPVLLLFYEQSRETDFDLDLLTETRTVRSQDSTKKFFLSGTDGSLCEGGEKSKIFIWGKSERPTEIIFEFNDLPLLRIGSKNEGVEESQLFKIAEICLSGL